MEKAPLTGKRRAGRPLSFDRDAALHQAMLLFWRQGYEGTSLSDLTAAMGVTPPSIYAAFGDKKRLFLEVVRRYLGDGVRQFAREPLTAREAARDFLIGAALKYTGDRTPSGCLIAGSAIACSPASADVQAELTAIRLEAHGVIRDRILTAIADGELPAETDAVILSGYIMTLAHGMATLARDGAQRDQLLQIIDRAMLSWPASEAAATAVPAESKVARL